MCDGRIFVRLTLICPEKNDRICRQTFLPLIASPFYFLTRNIMDKYALGRF